ncbi:hypothetical protein [Umezawaea sp. Da 62-37]|uniref:hypothetical protein n=1 Tax=Umezawaea sp. Da 62-37 TaxID=3075927 RepID=UPI0028F6C2C4|nr:hypothetical protein [Umezawaea sp. Da 62-37]WNV88128.1 hypothetical protein RM788_07510 [Umezawaea sp. Da 62-37]
MSSVELRVWAVEQAGVGVAVDVAAVVGQAVRIWATAGVELRWDGRVRDARVSSAKGDFKDVVLGELAEQVNPEITANGFGWVDVVLLPRLWNRWGVALSLLTGASAGNDGSFAPFTGPVVLVATEASVGAGDRPEFRADACAPLPDRAYPTPPVVLGAGNDLAHELGHVFGLWHTNVRNRHLAKPYTLQGKHVRLLMHETLHTTGEKITEGVDPKRSRGNVAGTSVELDPLTLVTDHEGWCVVLRGEALLPVEADYARKAVDEGLVWKGR